MDRGIIPSERLETMIGFIKIALFLWIASTVYRWYKKSVLNRAERRQAAEYHSASNPRVPPSGRIEDADFEEMDGDTGKSR
jgi:hypothetical protein